MIAGDNVRSTRVSAPNSRSPSVNGTSPTLTVRLPFPDPKLSPNGRHHYLVKNAAFQAAKDGAVVAIRATGAVVAGREQPIRMIAHFRCPDKRRRDLDNLLASIKPYIDALVQCGVIDDDNLIEEILLRKTIDRLDPGLTLEVSSCEPLRGPLSSGDPPLNASTPTSVAYPRGTKIHPSS